MSDQGINSRVTGRIDCRYETADGASKRYSLIGFDDLRSQYDSRNRIWKSGGTAISDDRLRHKMALTYDESRRILTIDLNGYVFTADQSQVMASSHNDRSTLNINFLRDAEGVNAAGEHFTIKGNSRLDISL